MGAAFEISLPLALRMFATTAAVLAALAVCIWFVSRLPHLLRLVGSREHVLRLTNQGNVLSRYQIVVESPHKPLRFLLARQGRIPLDKLQPAAVDEEADAAWVDEAQPAPQSPPAGKAAAAPNQAAQAKPGAKGKNPTEALQKAGKTAKSAAGFSGALGGLLGMLGSLIPGAGGQQLRAQAAAMRQAQTDTMRAAQAPEANLRKVDAMKKQGAKVGGSLGQKGQSEPAQPASAGRQPEISGAAGAAEPAGRRGGAQRKTARRKSLRQPPGFYGVQTDELAPGETMQLHLYLRWQRFRLPETSLNYTITSQQVPVGFASQELLPPVSRQGVVFFGAPPAWRYVLYYLGAALVIAATLFSFVAIYAWIWA